ncbi:hypothetical protein C7444_101107 [Sphaerotilus hippei]|uniref:Uncharacterized protein n=1 Tax=Sphaerotilus hippei TaxID=744406 RepID=A0A318H8P9_9BURK|nr:hypothetical protein [Sphaerotilus hippei]PXW99278.1 hypothetical protein C7444_101107 [Sphaerotilus hippei]
MATKPNYQFEKRQREMAKKKKKAEKEQRKTTGGPSDGQEHDNTQGAAPGQEDAPSAV